ESATARPSLPPPGCKSKCLLRVSHGTIGVLADRPGPCGGERIDGEASVVAVVKGGDLDVPDALTAGWPATLATGRGDRGGRLDGVSGGRGRGGLERWRGGSGGPRPFVLAAGFLCRGCHPGVAGDRRPEPGREARRGGRQLRLRRCFGPA